MRQRPNPYQIQQLLSKLDINEVLFGLILFTLPISLKLNSLAIGIFTIYNLMLRIRLKSTFGLRFFMVMILFFAVQVLGFFLSSNNQEALKKLILFACFPMFWVFFPTKGLSLERVFLWLVFGTCVILAYAFSLAFFEIMANGARYDYGRGPELLLKFAPHHAYLSMFIIISSLTIFYSVGNHKIKPMYLLLVIPFIIVLFILPSRTALLISFLILPIAAFLFLRQFFEFKRIIFLGALLIGLFLLGLSFDFARDKLLYTYYELFNVETAEKPFYGISRREKIWDAAISLLSDLPFFGLGIGDVQDTLDAKYIALGYEEIVGYNAHNQFFQYILQYGYLVFTIIVTPIVFVVVSLARKKEWLLLSFWVVLIMFCFSESMLNRQWGIIFFSVLLCFSTYRDNYNALFGKRKNSSAIRDF